jgi:hypothetical protein
MLEMTPLRSSNIAACGYDPETRVLRVEFTGGATYEYAGVDPSAYEGLVGADSAGEYFHRHIRNLYPTRRL